MIGHIIWDARPEIFAGMDFFRWYGLCWVVGILAGQWIMVRVYREEHIPAIEVDFLVIYMMVGAIVGARLGHILFYEPVYYLSNPVEILPVRIHPTFEFTGLSGLASHGGVFGALLALYFYNRKFKRGYVWLLDRIMIAGAALGAFIRLGNLMNSEIIGTPTDVPWAFVFVQVDEIPRHPAQLYEAIFYLAVSISLYLVWKSKRFAASRGFIFGTGMVLIFTQRFLMEFVKENQVTFEEGMILNMGQLLSIPLTIIGVVLILRSRGVFATRSSDL